MIIIYLSSNQTLYLDDLLRFEHGWKARGLSSCSIHVYRHNTGMIIRPPKVQLGFVTQTCYQPKHDECWMHHLIYFSFF